MSHIESRPGSENDFRLLKEKFIDATSGKPRDIVDPNRLFTLETNPLGDSWRAYWRYEGGVQALRGPWIEDETWEEYVRRNKEIFNKPGLFQYVEVPLPFTFEPATSLVLRRHGDFTLRKGSYGSFQQPYTQMDSNHEMWKDINAVKFFQEVRDIVVAVCYQTDLQTLGVSLSQLEYQDYEDRKFAIHGGEDDFLSFNFDDRGVIVETREYDASFSRLEKVPLAVDLLGRRITIDQSEDSMILTVDRVKQPEVVDFEMIIPKKQPVVSIIDYDGEQKTLFAWERDLLPDPLLRDPKQEASDLDNYWRLADLNAVLGIQIIKSRLSTSV